MTYLDWLDKHHLHKWEISPRTAFDAGYEEGQEAERERIRARAKIAAEKAYLIEEFVDALLEDGDAN